MRPAIRRLLLSRPNWAARGSRLHWDFSKQKYFGGKPQDYLSCARSSANDYAPNSAGRVIQFGANQLRITDLGVWREDQRTNVVLWCRDLTNAAWTKSNVTAALDQVGADGAANSASSITATAGNGTVLQAITLASSARFQSAFVKRLTGSGAVQMTTDNGSTWTAIILTSSYQQLSIPTQTLANPTVGFRLVTSGDAIAVDFVQNENGATGPTTPILTTTGSATRQADVIQSTRFDWFNLAGSTMVARFRKPFQSAGYETVFAWSDGTTGERVQMDVKGGALLPAWFSTSSGHSSQLTGDGLDSISTAAFNTVGVAAQLDDVVMYMNGLPQKTDTSFVMPAATRLDLGSFVPASQGGNMCIAELIYFPTRLSNNDMVARTGKAFPTLTMSAENMTGTIGLHILETKNGIAFANAPGVTNPVYDFSPSSSSGFSDIAFSQSQQKYFVLYSIDESVGTQKSFGIASASALAGPWTHVTDVSIIPSCSGTCYVWAPRFFVDDDSTIHITCVAQSGGTYPNAFLPYIVSAQNAVLSSWSAPTEITGSFPASIEDPFMLSPAQSPNGKYNIFFSRPGALAIQRASSAARASGYAIDSANLGFTGDSPMPINYGAGVWRLYVYNPGLHQFKFSDSIDDWQSWSSQRDITSPIATGPGGFLRVIP